GGRRVRGHRGVQPLADHRNLHASLPGLPAAAKDPPRSAAPLQGPRRMARRPGDLRGTVPHLLAGCADRRTENALAGAPGAGERSVDLLRTAGLPGEDPGALYARSRSRYHSLNLPACTSWGT